MSAERVFAYGSNLCQLDLARWLDERGYTGLRPSAVEPATLLGSALTWNYHSPVRKGGAANVSVREGAAVPGAVLTVSAALREALDVKEGHPERYFRSLEPVEVGARSIEAWVYRVTPAYHSATEDVWPTRSYLDVVIRGATALGLPAPHLERLRTTPVS